MSARLLVPVFLLLASPLARAGSVLVIDDFTDPARIEFPDGPETAVTQGVGDLNAERTLGVRRTSPSLPIITSAEVNSGQYVVNLEDPGETTLIDATYTFPTFDFSQYEAILIDINPASFSTHPLVPPVPSLMVVAIEAVPRPWRLTLVRDFPGGVGTGRLVHPLDSFLDRGGDQVDADWSVINELRITVGSGRGWGTWEARIDRIALGPAVPEPTTLCVLTGSAGWLLLSRLKIAACGRFRM